MSQNAQTAKNDTAKKPALPVGGSRNVEGPAVYYPPGHVPFAKKDAPVVAGGGGYQSAVSRILLSFIHTQLR